MDDVKSKLTFYVTFMVSFTWGEQILKMINFKVFYCLKT